MKDRLQVQVTPSALPQNNVDFLNEADPDKEWPVWNIINAEDFKKQMSKLNEVLLWINGDGVTEKKAVFVIQNFFIPLYLSTSFKSPLKRRLASCLECIDGKYAAAIALHLEEAIQNLLGRKDSDRMTERLTVNNCNSLLDKFSLGEMAILKDPAMVLQFLVGSLQNSNEICKNATSPADISQDSHDSLVTVQVYNKVLQRADSKIILLGYKTGACNLMEAYELTKSMLKESSRLDLKCNCAMTMAFIVNIIHAEKFPEKMSECLKSSVVSGLAEDTTFPVKELSLCSYLCWLNGVLVVMSYEQSLTKTEPGGMGFYACSTGVESGTNISQDLFITDVIGKALLDGIDGLTDVDSKIIASRTLVLLTNKISELLQWKEIDNHANYPVLCSKIVGNGVISKRLLTFAWEYWEDTTDCIRHQAQTIFENVVTCHILVTREEPSESTFLHGLCQSLFDMGDNEKGRYGPLCCMVDHLGATTLLLMRPQLPSYLLQLTSEQTLIAYVSQFFQKLATVHKKELLEEAKRMGNSEVSATEAWQKMWIDPLQDIICNGSPAQRKFTVEYILAKMMKDEPQIVKHMAQQLSNDNVSFGALITCLKQAKGLGILHQLAKEGLSLSSTKDIEQQDSDMLWNNIIPISVLQNALKQQNEQIRLDVYGLVCEQQKNTEPICRSDLQLVFSFLEHNVNNQEPAFRQQMLALSKKLLMRMRDSWNCIAVSKRKKKSMENQKEDCIPVYQTFLTQLSGLLFCRIRPDAAFPSRTSSLALLNLLVQVLHTDPSDHGPKLQLEDWCTPSRIHTLLSCLTDSFENNKIETFDVLRALAPKISSKSCIQDEELKGLLDSALTLASSTRPQDGTTAAYLFKFLTCLPEFYNVVQNEFLKLENSFEARSLCVLTALLVELKAEIETAKVNLLHASATKPVYPALHCVRYMLQDINISHVSNLAEWRHLVAEVVSTCFVVAEIVSPVVSHCSPEGNVPEEAIMGPGLAITSVGGDDNSKEFLSEVQSSTSKVTLMPEYLVVCCWRSIKEVSLLLAQLTQTMPISHSLQQEGLLSMKRIRDIGSYFTRQLLESRHRGAFELAYAGFVKMTETLWNSRIKEAQELPRLWLEGLVQDIVQDGENSKLCATRRSAGVPFYIQAVVSTEPASRQRTAFHWLIKQLLPLALAQETADSTENIPQVHALNILRTLYRDTRLGNDVTPYIADGFRAAIVGYSSRFWAIRNSATLLFSALMTRTFGVKRSKDDSSRKNCMTGRTFFRKLPSLYDFLLRSIEDATRKSDSSGRTQLQPGLYPVLLVLSRLLPSTIDDSNAFSMAAFIPYVIKCAGSAVLKTRLVAARAMCPLVGKTQLSSTVTLLLDCITPKDNQQRIPHNFQHGVLLQIQQLVDVIDIESPGIMLAVLSILPKLPQLKTLAQRTNQCLLVRKVAVEVLVRILRICLLCPSSDLVQSKEVEELEVYLLNEFDFIVSSLSKDKMHSGASNHEPGFVEFHKDVAMVYIHLVMPQSKRTWDEKEHVLLNLLRSDLYEAKLVVLEYLVGVLDQSYISDEMVYTDDRCSPSCGSEDVMHLRKSIRISSELVTLLTKDKTYFECTIQCLELLYLLDSSILSTNCLTKEQNSKLICKLLNLLQDGHDSIRYTALQLLGKILPYILLNVEDLGAYMTVIEAESTIPEDTKGQIITDADNTGPKVNQLNLAIDSPDTTEPDSREKEKLLEHLVDLLEERSGTLQSVESRLACARFLLHNRNTILLPADIPSALVDVVLRAWNVLMRLLQDEHIDVRETMASFVGNLEPAKENGAIHVSIALQMTLDTFTNNLMHRLPMKSVGNILNWIEEDIEPDWDTEEKEVRLFDKGEMNTFRDEGSFIETTSHHLRDVLNAVFACKMQSGNLDINQPLVQSSDSCKNRVVVPELSQEAKEHLIDFLSNHFCRTAEELNSRLEWITPPTLSDVFLTQNEYRSDSMYILRKVVVLRVLYEAILGNTCDLDISLEADVMYWGDRLRSLLDSKLCLHSLGVGEEVEREVEKFSSHVEQC